MSALCQSAGCARSGVALPLDTPIKRGMSEIPTDAPSPPAEPPPPPPPEGPTSDDKTMALLAHLLAIPAGIFGPLIIWLIKKDQSAFVNDQGKEALNFQLTVMLAGFAMGIMVLIPLVGCLVLPALLALGLANLILSVIGGVKANEGVRYRYPFNFRLIK